MRAIGRQSLLMLALLLGACANLPGEAARGTPAAPVAMASFAALSTLGVPLGSAVAVAPDRLLTNAHVLPPGVTSVLARRGDGRMATEAVVLGRSARLDLAVLGVAPGIFLAATVEAAPPVPGASIWAIGAPAAGPAIARGRIEQSGLHLTGRGPGFTARIGALMGYSGGPGIDAEGRIRGLVTALVRPGAAPVLAALTGLDLDGLSRNGEFREVFFLSIDVAMAESERIARNRGQD